MGPCRINNITNYRNIQNNNGSKCVITKAGRKIDMNQIILRTMLNINDLTILIKGIW